MIYTSYFAKYKGNDGVSIARHSPSWFKGQECKELAPSSSLLKWWKSLSKEQQSSTDNVILYAERYIKETLSKVDVFKLAKELDEKVLLCYENLDMNFCHRQVVACWFQTFGIQVEELK